MKLMAIRLCRRLAPDIANMCPAMYSLRISALRSSSRYSPGVRRLGFGDDMGASMHPSRGDASPGGLGPASGHRARISTRFIDDVDRQGTAPPRAAATLDLRRGTRLP